MATNKRSVKIEDITDEVDSVWGEEHEEKRKGILVDNIIKLPLYTFCVFSLLYFSAIIIAFPFLISLSGDEGSSRIWLVHEIFNIPYYIFDLRIGVISSIASLLLSLFVSVGKFADGETGLIGEARRAAYRKFAKIVGYIVFVAFILSFWHGFWAGYFNGTSYAPEIFGGWRVGPGWGKLIVAEDVNLARYGEMPLWIMLFFAWFTLASCLMLTYNEKDILIRSVYTFQKLKNINNFQKSQYMREYNLAKRELGSSGIDSPTWSSEYRITKYGDLFSRNIRSDDFKFKFMGKEYWSKPVVISFCLSILLNIVFIGVLLFCFQEMGLLLSILIFIFELLGWIAVFSGLWRYPSIFSVDSTEVRSKIGSFAVKQFGIFIFRFGDIFYALVILASLLSAWQREIDIIIPLIVLVSFLLGVTFREIAVYNFRQLLKYNSKILLIYKYFGVLDSSLNDKDIFIPRFGFWESFRFVFRDCRISAGLKIQSIWMKRSSIPWVGNGLSKLPGGKTPPNPYLKKRGVDYIALAYIYFIMIRAVEYYMDYKSEIDGKKSGEKEKQGSEDAQAPNSNIKKNPSIRLRKSKC